MSQIKILKKRLREAEAELRRSFDEQALVQLVEEEKYALLTIPGVYEAASEYLNNDAMDLADATGIEFEVAVEELLTSMSAEEILRIPGMAEELLEEFHSELV